MKKFLAILCAIAVFVSSLSGALVFTFADPATEPTGTAVTLPAVKDSEGKYISLYPDTDLTELGVVGSDKISVVKNTTDLPFTSLYAATGSDAVKFAPVEAMGHKGIMMYVEIPDIGPVTHTYDNSNEYTTNQFRFAVHFDGYDKTNPSESRSVFSYMYGGNWYSMPVGSSQWEAEEKKYYGIQLEYGFKGYVYLPFATFTDSGRTITDDYVVTAVTIRQLKNTTDVFYSDSDNSVYYGYVTEENPIVYSLPMFVADDATTDNPSTKSIVVGEKEYCLDKRNTPYTYAELNAVKAIASSTGVVNTTTSNGRRFLKGGQSALTSNVGTTMQSSRTYNNDFNAESYTSVAEFGSVALSSTEGWIIHVSIPSLDNKQTVSFQFTDVNGTNRNVDKAAGGTTWYVLPDGATSWVEKGAEDWYDNYKVIVGDGTEPFSGYIYLPKKCLNNYSSGITNIKTINVGVLPWRYSNKQPTTSVATPIDVSSVSLVTGFNKDTTLAYADTGALVDLVTGDVVRTDYQATKPFYGYATVNDTKNYLTAKAATLKAYAHPRYPVTEGTHFAKSGNITVDYAAGVAPLMMDVASYKIGGTSAPARSHYISTELDSIVIGDTKGILFYIETVGQYGLGFMQAFTKAAGGTAYEQFGYASTVRYLADGATEWASTTAQTPVNGVSQLPENFKGYVYVPYVGTRDSADKLFRFTVFIATATDGATVDAKIGGISLVSNFTEENAGLIKYNGAAETQNMFSGEYYVPVTAETEANGSSEDTSSEESSSEEVSSEASSEESSSEEVSSEVSSEESSSEETSSEESSSAESSSEETSSDVTSDTSSEEENDFVAPDGITNIFNPAGTAVITPTDGTTLTEIDSLIPVTVNKSVKVEGYTEGTIAHFKYGDTAEKAIGVMVYIETEVENPYVAIATGGKVYGADGVEDGTYKWPATSYQYGSFYYLAEGDTEWKKSPDALNSSVKYFRQIPAPNGFKGYVYMPFNDSITNNVKCESAIIEYAYAKIQGNEATAPVYMGSYMLVKEFHADSAYATVDNKKCINMFDGTEYVPDTSSEESSSEEVSSEASSEESSSDEASSDTSSGDTPTRPTDEPDYDLPKYTGTAPDYTGYSISRLWVARLNEKVFVGYPFANPSDCCGVVGGNYEVINSVAPITNYPSMKVTATDASATVKHYLDASTTKGATAVLYYVEAPADKAITVSFRVNAHKESGGNAYGSNYSRPIYVLAEGSSEWTTVATAAYNATLPAGFKGYIRQDYKDLAQIKEVADISTVSAYYVSLIVTDIVANDEFKISAPILMDETSDIHSQVTAFVEDDVAARNLFTADFVLPGDASLGEQRIPRPEEEPDYDIPKYTGEALDYNGYNISNVWIARLNDKVFVGNVIEEAAGSVTNFGYEIINSITKISNYPSFELKLKAGQTSGHIVYNTSAAKSTGATSILYYVELPEGKSAGVSFRTNFQRVGTTNFYGNNSNAKVHYMAEGGSEWTTVKSEGYWAELPAGFKGYVRLDYSIFSGKVDSTATLYQAWLMFNGLTENDVVKASAPILMNQTSDIHSKTAVFVEGDVAARNLFTADFVLPGDASLGEIRIPKPEVEPDYDLPYYTGSKPDYSEYSISKAWVARVNESVFIGYPLSGMAASNSSFTGKYEFIESITPITKYPSIMLTPNSDSKTVSAAIYTEEQIGASAAMYYVELPEGKSASIRIALNFDSSKTENGALIGVNYSRKVYILPEGATEWTEVKTEAYYSQLPAGFKGYVRQDYSDLSGAGGAIPDKEDALYSSNLFFNVENGSTVKVSAPILLDRFTPAHVVTGVFVNEDTAVRNLFTGNHVMPGDKSLGEPKQPIPEEEPNYDLPNYTGKAPDYSEYTVSKAWVAKLNDKVFVGYPFSEKAATVSGADSVAIDSAAAITKYPSLKLTATETTITTGFNPKAEFGSGATAAMFYVELEAGKTADIAFRLNFQSPEGPFYCSNYSRPIYILKEGDSEWTQLKTEKYYATLPAGFKGYVRQDYANMNATKKDTTPGKDATLYYASAILNNVAKGDNIVITAPILLDRFTAAHVVTGAFINDDTAVRNYFTGKHVMPGDKSLGEPKQPIPEEEPNYDLPHYTGEKPDYTNYNFSNYWIAKLNDKVFVGYDMPEKAATATGATLFAIDSITPITKYPSIKVTATDSTATLGFNPKAESATGANSALFYIEAPADKEITVSYRLNFKKEGEEKNLYGNNYNKSLYIMSEGDKNWKSVTATAYNATLPAGFKGYIRQDYSLLNVDADETWTLYYEGLIIGGLEAGDVVNVSAPILADAITSDRLPNGAYIEKDPKAPRELFTGKFLLPGDKDLGGPTVEPDYKVPAYTGTPINYGKLDIMNVRTAKLNGSIIIGRALSEDVYKISTGKGEAVKSLVGVSNYPMLSLKGMEIPVGERVTVVTGNYDWKANLGATSVMFYVQIPEGQDTDFAITWSWHHEDGRTTGAYNYNGNAYLMGKDQKKWKAVDISKYWIDLPAGYEGYIRFDLKDVWCVYPFDENGNVIYKLDEDGNKIYKDPNNKNLGFVIDSDADHKSLKDDKWGLQTAYIQLSNAVEGAKSDAIISSPILIDEFIPLQTIQNIAHVDGDTNAARHIFTGAVMKLGDFDATAGAEPNYDIPFHTGKEENYDKISIMKTRTSKLNYAVLIGEEFSPTALTMGAETLAMPVKSIHPLSNYPAIEMKNLGKGDVNVTMKTDPEKNAGAIGLMFYVKAPADTETGLRFSFSFTNVKDGRVTGAFNYSGNAYIMDKNATEWSYVNISKYYVSLPAGFEGYVRYELAKIHTVYSYDENGKPRIEYDENGKLKILSDGDHNYLNEDWGLGVAYTYMSGIPQGEKGYISAPIMVDAVDETSTTPRATFHNGEKFARDIFTGEVLKRTDLLKPVQKGDTLKKLPDPTTELKAKVTDKTKLGEGKVTISWAAFEGAAKYVIRVFKNLQGATGLVYNCVGVYETTETTFEITGLAKNTRYSVVIYALDAEGNEIAVYDYVTVSTVGAKAPAEDKTDDTDVPVEENKGMPIWGWILIGVGALLIIAGGTVAVIIIIKKKKAKAA